MNPVKCFEHHRFGGHLLLHIFDQIPLFQFPVGLEMFNTFPIQSGWSTALLVVLTLSYGHEELAWEMLLQHLDKQHLAQVSELLKAVKGSQVASLALLLGIATRLISSKSYFICPEEVAMMSLCIGKALELSSEQRSSLLIRPLVIRVQELGDLMITSNRRSTEDNEVASLATVEAVNRLKSHMATLMIVGRQNSRALSCSQTHGSYSPAIGWLDPYTD